MIAQAYECRTTLLRMLAIQMMVTNTVAADTIDDSGQPPYEQCGYCHEYDGNSVMSDFPRLAGQNSGYLKKQLEDFRAGLRPGRMQATAELLTDRDIRTVVAYFSRQPIRTRDLDEQPTDSRRIAQHLFLNGDRERNITACSTCHGLDGVGQAEIPRLAGQHSAYLNGQLQQFKQSRRRNDHKGEMRKIATRLSDSEIDALAEFLERLTPLTVGGDTKHHSEAREKNSKNNKI